MYLIPDSTFMSRFSIYAPVVLRSNVPSFGRLGPTWRNGVDNVIKGFKYNYLLNTPSLLFHGRVAIRKPWCEKLSIIIKIIIWRDIYLERGFFLSHTFFRKPGGANAWNSLQAISLERSPRCPWSAACPSFDSRFSAFCLNLTVWFSSRGLPPVTHLLYPTALMRCPVY